MWVERKGGLNGRGSLGILMGVESKIVKIQVLYIGVERNSVGREIFCGANRTTLSLFFFFFFSFREQCLCYSGPRDGKFWPNLYPVRITDLQ